MGLICWHQFTTMNHTSFQEERLANELCGLCQLTSEFSRLQVYADSPLSEPTPICQTSIVAQENIDKCLTFFAVPPG